MHIKILETLTVTFFVIVYKSFIVSHLKRLFCFLYREKLNINIYIMSLSRDRHLLIGG